MTKRWTAAVLICAFALAMGACSRNEEPPQRATAPERAEPEGTPRTVLSGDGVAIQYRVYGRGEPAVVLVHGWSCDSSYWDAQLEPLKGKYTVVTVDLAGHGSSGRNRTEWSTGNYGEDVAAVVRQLPNQQVILVGHSMGGPVTLEAAPRIGERVIGIVGVDTLKTVGEPPIPQERLENYLAPFRVDFSGHTRQFVTDTFFPEDVDPQLVNRVAQSMAQAPPEVAIPSMESVIRMDVEAALAHIEVPIVAINSDLGGPTDEARIRQHAPTFRAVIMPDTGHFPMLEDPERFNEILLREIAALAEGARRP